MESQKQLIESLAGHTEELVETTVELIKLKVVDTSIRITSGLLTGLVVGLLSTVCVLFLSVGMAFWLGKILGEVYLGFIIMAAVFILITIMCYYLLPGKLDRVIGRIIIQKAFQQP